MKSSSVCSGISEIMVCQSKTTLCSSTAALSTEFILRGQRDDTEDIKLDKRSKEAIKVKTRGRCLGCDFRRWQTKIFRRTIRTASMDPNNQWHNGFEGETSAGSQQDSFRNLSLWTEMGKCGKPHLKIAIVRLPLTYPPAWSCIASGDKIAVKLGVFVSRLLCLRGD